MRASSASRWTRSSPLQLHGILDYAVAFVLVGRRGLFQGAVPVAGHNAPQKGHDGRLPVRLEDDGLAFCDAEGSEALLGQFRGY